MLSKIDVDDEHDFQAMKPTVVMMDLNIKLVDGRSSNGTIFSADKLYYICLLQDGDRISFFDQCKVYSSDVLKVVNQVEISPCNF